MENQEVISYKEITRSNINQATVQHYFTYAGGKLFWKNTSNKRTDLKNKQVGNISDPGYYKTSINNTSYYVHQLIFLYHHGVMPEMVDHENHNRLDNRIENLRGVDRNTSARNYPKRIDNKTGQTGVLRTKFGKYRAYINYDKVRYQLGEYVLLADAITARKAAEKKFGYHPNHGS